MIEKNNIKMDYLEYEKDWFQCVIMSKTFKDQLS